MSTIIFDGRKYAKSKESALKDQCKKLVKKGITPKLTSILVGGNQQSKLYLTLKQDAVKRIGAEMEIVKCDKKATLNTILDNINKANKDKKVHGVMIQLPLPDRFSKSDWEKIIKEIDKTKDVDGMRDDGEYIAPVAWAVSSVLKQAEKKVGKKKNIVVLGSKGFAGKKILRQLNNEGYDVEGLDIGDKLPENTKLKDVVISATGKKSLVTKNFVKKGAVVIDVGAPKGDVDTLSIVDTACFISAVPGGVGPVTIAYLLKNLVNSACKEH